jgi:hypothetical protein
MYEYQSSLVDLANRIAQLEEALRASHEQNSKEPHPLLDEDRLRIKEPFLRQARETSYSPEPSSGISQSSGGGTADSAGLDELNESLDALSLSSQGRSKYVGPVAWSSVSASLGGSCRKPSAHKFLFI